MDPEKALEELRELAKQIIAVEEGTHSFEIPEDAVEMAEKFQELDEWIMSGGFLPKDWRRS